MKEKDIHVRRQLVIYANHVYKNQFGQEISNMRRPHVLRTWYYPYRILNAHRRWFMVIMAAAVLRFPKHHLVFRDNGYDPETREKLDSERLKFIRKNQSRLKKAESILQQYKEEMKDNLFFHVYADENSPYKDEKLLLLIKEVEVKKEALKMANEVPITEIVT